MSFNLTGCKRKHDSLDLGTFFHGSMVQFLMLYMLLMVDRGQDGHSDQCETTQSHTQQAVMSDVFLHLSIIDRLNFFSSFVFCHSISFVSFLFLFSILIKC